MSTSRPRPGNGAWRALAAGFVLGFAALSPWVAAAGEPAARIVGGRTVASPGGSAPAFPWFVQLLRAAAPLTAYCGGTLVSPDHVLTAAHCVDPASGGVRPRHVLVGPRDLEDPGAAGTRIAVRRVITNPRYLPGLLDGDVALLELARPAPARSLVRVTRTPLPDGTLATVIGFGAIAENGPLSNRLRAVTVPTVSLAACRAALAPVGLVITSNMLCAGVAAGGRDACTGDSGGPLFVTGADGAPTQIGVVSFGIGCGRPGVPAVYTGPRALQSFLRAALALEGTLGLGRSALTPNQRALASVLDRNRARFEPRMLDAYVDLVLQLDAERRRSLDSLSPIDALAGIDLAHHGAGALRRAIRARLDRIASPDPLPAAADDRVARGETAGVRYFVDASRTRADASMPGSRDDHVGHLTIGIDARAGQSIDVGVALGHARGRARPGGLARVGSDAYQIAAYAQARVPGAGPLAGARAAGLVGYGHLEHRHDRTLHVGPARRHARAAPGGDMLIGSVEVATDVPLGLDWTGFAGLDFGRLRLDRYREHGAGDLSLAAVIRDDLSLDSRFGLRASRVFDSGGGPGRLTIRPSVSLSRLMAHGDARAVVDARLRAVPDAAFRSTGASRDRRWLELEAGADAGSADGTVAFSLRYRRTFSRREAVRAIAASARFAW